MTTLKLRLGKFPKVPSIGKLPCLVQGHNGEIISESTSEVLMFGQLALRRKYEMRCKKCGAEYQLNTR